MKIIFIFLCSGMFQNVPCSGFYRRPNLNQASLFIITLEGTKTLAEHYNSRDY